VTRTHKILLGTAAAATAAGVSAAIAAAGAPAPDDNRSGPRLPAATEAVERGDLSDITQVDGNLGYARERKHNAATAGMVTWTARTAATVRRGERLYSINGIPVRLMYGTGAMYRTLKPGDTGADVRQVEENLAALGWTGFTVDDEYSDASAAAVRRWQKAHDLQVTGTLGPDQVAFAPSAVRVKHVETAVGDQAVPGQAVITTTRTDRVVTFDLDVDESRFAKTGTKLSITLPDGKQAKARVSSVGRTATDGDDPTDSPKVAITATFERPTGITGPDQAPVTVRLLGRTRRQVLSVPVSALLALPSGDFGIQIVENGTVREQKVELGLFADGRVEITGDRLREGMRVGVPKL
jgi:peptidoglycan hydrolase-like protein with peptidoglycan-binding domain